jgi:hypothetical protein
MLAPKAEMQTIVHHPDAPYFIIKAIFDRARPHWKELSDV